MESIISSYMKMLSEVYRKHSPGINFIGESENIALDHIKQHNPSYDVNQNHPASSILHQYVIGKANELATSGNEEYKKRVFHSYKTERPDLTGDSHDYDSLVNHSYDVLKKHTHEQFKSLPISVTFHPGDMDYHSSKHMVDDVNKNRHLAVFNGGEPHTHLGKIEGVKENANNMFRAVHDFYGHAVHGNQFGPKGEEIAWSVHKQMFPEAAHPALTAETRGQNSQVNYTTLNLKNLQNMHAARVAANNATDPYTKSKHLDTIKKIGANFNYAKQKASVLPHEMNSPVYNGGVPHSIKPLLRDKGADMNPNYDTEKDHLSLHALAKLHAPGDVAHVTKKLAEVHGYTGITGINESTEFGVHDTLIDTDYAQIRRKK